MIDRFWAEGRESMISRLKKGVISHTTNGHRQTLPNITNIHLMK